MKPIGLFVLLTVLVYQAIGLAERVDIPDPNLRRVLRLALQINVGEEISEDALSRLVSLNASDKRITDLNGLGHCTHHLTVLDLSSNQLTDLNGLVNANLPNLKVVYLYNNQLKNLSGLTDANLPSLVILHLASNQLANLEGLIDANFPSLKALDLNNNHLANLNELANFTNLTFLQLESNQISDISALVKNEDISGTIILKNNPLSDIALSIHIPALAKRKIKIEYDMPVVDIPDPNLLRVLELALQINAGEKITKDVLARLTSLNVSDKGITNLNGLAHCTNLTYLNLDHNLMTDLNGLTDANLLNLTVLDLGVNQLTDLNGLADANFPKLTYLNLNTN